MVEFCERAALLYRNERRKEGSRIWGSQASSKPGEEQVDADEAPLCPTRLRRIWSWLAAPMVDVVWDPMVRTEAEFRLIPLGGDSLCRSFGTGMPQSPCLPEGWAVLEPAVSNFQLLCCCQKQRNR